MHAVSVLQKCLGGALGRMDRRRMRTLLLAVSALLVGRRLVLMELARHWPGAQRVWAPLKRVDRLLSNRHLHGERVGVYAAMARWLVRGQRPVILVDWTPLKSDGQWQVLRAGIAVGGRSMTLYEAVYRQCELNTPKVERAFLARLARLLPADCQPIVVTDAGFRVPWFRAVRRHGWDYVGRLRARTRVQLTRRHKWMAIRSLYERASHHAQRWAQAQIVQSRPWPCELVLYRRRRRGRVHLSCQGKASRAGHSRKQARREREPWLLVTSLSANEITSRQVVGLYHRRMQIEQSFRDLKSARFGAAFRYSLTRTAARLQILLLIHALATFVAWLAGLSLDRRSRSDYAGMSAQRARRHYSALRLGYEALKRGHIGSVRRLYRTLVGLPDTVIKQMTLAP